MMGSKTTLKGIISYLLFFNLSCVIVISCSEGGISSYNTPPSAEITHPDDGSIFTEGDMIEFSGVVGDSQDAPENLQIEWRSNQDGLLDSTPPDSSGKVAFSTVALSVGSHVITLKTFDSDGQSGQDSISLKVEPPNTPPSVSINSPSDGDKFIEGENIIFSGYALDVDDLETDLFVEWVSDIQGSLYSGAPDSTGYTAFTSSALEINIHTITLRATDTAGEWTEAHVTIEVEEENNPPSQPTVEITPSSPYTDDDLVAVISVPSIDPEGAPVSYSYQWYRDSILEVGAVTSTISSSMTSKGEEWSIHVTPSDGILDGPEGIATITILNSVPSISSASISPSPAYESSTITATPSGSYDADGDSISYIYDWYIDSTLYLSGSTSYLTGSDFDRGNQIYCTITPYDGEDYGTSVTTATVEVVNTPPSAPSVEVSPSPATPADTLFCNVILDSTDDDGDPVTYSYQWYIDGVIESSITGNTVSSSYLSLGEEWECRVTPSDGIDTGDYGSDSTLILPASGDLIITEMMVNPASVSDLLGEYIELYNASTYTIDLNGFVISDDASDYHTINPGGPLSVESGNFIVLGINSDYNTNGGIVISYEYTNVRLDNSSDSVVISFEDVEVDRVEYDYGGSFPALSGSSYTLDPDSFDSTSNDSPDNWCGATTRIGPSLDFGTPGFANDHCECYYSDDDNDFFGDSPLCSSFDCDDGDATIYPGAEEICEDGIDQDCDLSDELCVCSETDDDGDGYGDGLACTNPDCDDSNPNIHPWAFESCNGVDDDCDGEIDEGYDNDHDHWTTCEGDCNDSNGIIYPTATEICDGLDNDCDGDTDEGFDNDSDGYTTCEGDCDDSNPSINPGMMDTCDSYDNDCDGIMNENGGDSYERNESLSSYYYMGSYNDTSFSFSATIHNSTDLDYFGFSTIDDESWWGEEFYVRVYLEVPSSVDYNLYLYYDGGLVDSSTNAGSADEEVYYEGTWFYEDGGLYIFSIIPQSSTWSCSPYTIYVWTDG